MTSSTEIYSEDNDELEAPDFVESEMELLHSEAAIEERYGSILIDLRIRVCAQGTDVYYIKGWEQLNSKVLDQVIRAITRQRNENRKAHLRETRFTEPNDPSRDYVASAVLKAEAKDSAPNKNDITMEDFDI